MAILSNDNNLLQGTGTTGFTTGAPAGASTGGLTVQGVTNANQITQPTTAPGYNQTLQQPGVQNTALVQPNVAPVVDPAAAAAAAKAAADAAQAAQLRDNITGLVGSIKDIFNSRYGAVDASGAEQAGKLQTRFGNESQTVAQGVQDQNNTAGASFAGRGTRDSSDYGNTVDTITTAGKNQVRDMGQELTDNLEKIASWVSQQKAGFDGSKGGLDAVMSHIAEQTDPNALATIRNQLESQIASLKAGGADNNTAAQNASSLETIAPSSARAVQLKTTLSKIVGGSAPAAQKATIGEQLINSAGLNADEQQKLLLAFQSDLSSTDPNKDTTTATA